MKKQTCCFTGHRKIPPEQYERIAQRLKAEITALIHRGVVYFEAGGALGFDTMAARDVLELKKDYTIVMVTHNMQQAARISDRTAFFLLGEVVEFGKTEQIFSMPKDKRTEDYITGRFG